MTRARARTRERRSGRGRRIVMIGYPEAQILDVTGPLEVFSSAATVVALRRRPAAATSYRSELVAPEAGPFRTSCGVALVADRALGEVRGPIDTLIVSGGVGSRRQVRNDALIAQLRRLAPRARRVASVCTGALLLAEAGLLDGRRATTHWGFCPELAARYPQVEVEPDPIFVRDGNVYSSAGVTAGMDLALALVEEDHGREVALEVARLMVVFLKRPGGQSQFSTQLQAQLAERTPLRELQSYIVDNPAADLSVDALASRCAMSPRHFARVFAAEIGTTPARFVEGARIEAARRALEESDEGVEGIADRCGFGTSETMRRAFLRSLRVGPSEYRSRFRSTAQRGRSGRTSSKKEKAS